MTADGPPVFVDGASGYIGGHLVWKLREQGRAVLCLVRSEASPADVDLLESFGAQVLVAGLADQQADVAKALEGVSAAVHLIGSIAPPRGVSFAGMHVGQTHAWIECCQKAKVPKVVMVTAVGAGPGAPSRYHATKGEAEEALRASGLRHAIVRPSLVVGRVVGRRDSKLVSRYRDLILKRRLVPLVNGGSSRVQPVFVGDLAEALAAVAAPEGPAGLTLEVGGPEVVTMREFVERLMRVLSTRKPVLGLPAGIARAIALVCESVQRVPILSRDQVAIALRDNVCRENALPSLLKRPPASLDEALETYRRTL